MAIFHITWRLSEFVQNVTKVTTIDWQKVVFAITINTKIIDAKTHVKRNWFSSLTAGVCMHHN